MATLANHPAPVKGAASYWADGKDVIMCDTNRFVSCIQTCRSEGTALDAAKRWQEKENRIVTREAKKAK